MQRLSKLFILLLAPLLLLSACSSSPGIRRGPVVEAEAGLRTAPLPDLSGHWEKNYQLSDDFNTLMELYIADIQRRYASPQTNSDLQAVASARGFSREAINGLARFAEELTRMPLLTIEQQEQGIRIDRELDFTLRCQWQDKLFMRSQNTFGSDVCGWNGDRLLFQMSMGGGLGITHQLSMSPDGRLLNLTTTVNSQAVAAPIVIRNVYRRYEVPEADYQCERTLTRNTVCSQRGSRQ